MHIRNKDLNLFAYPEITKTRLSDELEKLEQLCNGGIDFVHKKDVIELQNIIIESDKISLYFYSLGAILLNKGRRITHFWHLIHFNEAIQDKEIFPLTYIDLDQVDYEIAKLLLLISK